MLFHENGKVHSQGKTFKYICDKLHTLNSLLLQIIHLLGPVKKQNTTSIPAQTWKLEHFPFVLLEGLNET